MRRKGFTLVELIMVIVIIGLLAALVAPKMFSTSDAAYRALAQSVEASLRTGATFYYGSYQQAPPSFYNWVALSDGGSDRNYVRLDAAIRAKLADPAADVCDNNYRRITLTFKNGLVATYVINPAGGMTATYAGP